MALDKAVLLGCAVATEVATAQPALNSVDGYWRLSTNGRSTWPQGYWSELPPWKRMAWIEALRVTIWVLEKTSQERATRPKQAVSAVTTAA